MKKIFYITLSLFLGALFIISCEKKDNIAENNKWIYVDSVNNTNVRAIHCFAGNTPQLPTATLNTGPQIFVYANGAKLNGNALSYGGQWPSPSVYASIPQTGNVRFDIVMARLNFSAVPLLPAPIAGDTLLTVNANLTKGKFYSLYFGDTVGGPYRLQVVEDQLDLPQYQQYKIRLANWSMNPLDTLDVFSVRQQTNILTDVTHKQVSNWVEYPLPPISDTLYVRRKGTTVNITSVLGFVPAGLRMYTLVMRGKTGVTSKGASTGLLINR